MRKDERDPLYFVFEQHLFNALVEDETTSAFLDRVVTDYLARLQAAGTIIPQNFREALVEDLREEVLEMLRKKTYGHYNLAAYRKAHGAEVEAPFEAVQKQTSPSNRRAC